ncbi:hypothetical protein K440DRAFT_614176 [Wilcoxina mikolae CBS 423.85]|nr:hypothetical protein K440DRAFT_614176 [Wilcoxina mikolae CBS 423.85]
MHDRRIIVPKACFGAQPLNSCTCNEPHRVPYISQQEVRQRITAHHKTFAPSFRHFYCQTHYPDRYDVRKHCYCLPYSTDPKHPSYILTIYRPPGIAKNHPPKPPIEPSTITPKPPPPPPAAASPQPREA